MNELKKFFYRRNICQFSQQGDFKTLKMMFSKRNKNGNLE